MGGFFLCVVEGGIVRLPPQKNKKINVITFLIMLCIFVFTMGQLLRVHTEERTRAE